MDPWSLLRAQPLPCPQEAAIPPSRGQPWCHQPSPAEPPRHSVSLCSPAAAAGLSLAAYKLPCMGLKISLGGRWGGRALAERCAPSPFQPRHRHQPHAETPLPCFPLLCSPEKAMIHQFRGTSSPLPTAPPAFPHPRMQSHGGGSPQRGRGQIWAAPSRAATLQLGQQTRIRASHHTPPPTPHSPED